MSISNKRKETLSARKPELPRRMLDLQTGQNQCPRLHTVVASYAFMASDAFFS
jgi:hypothetical protein